MNIDLSEQDRQVISEGLSGCLANLYALYLKTQNFNWNLTGTEFYSLHLLFNKQYDEMAASVDEIAERIRALGYYVDASFSAFKKLSSVKDEDKVLNMRDMILSLIDGHEIVIRNLRRLSEIAEKARDYATVELLGQKIVDHEKMAWMLRSQL